MPLNELKSRLEELSFLFKQHFIKFARIYLFESSLVLEVESFHEAKRYRGAVYCGYPCTAF